MTTRIASPPRYITIVCKSRIEGHESIRAAVDLLARYNLAQDRIYKHFVEEYVDLQRLWRKYGLEVKRYSDLKNISESREKKLVTSEFYPIAYEVLGNSSWAEGAAFEVYATLKSLNALRLKLREIDRQLAERLPSDSEIGFDLWRHITCIGRATKYDKGNRNVRLITVDKAIVNLIAGKATIPLYVRSRKYREVLARLVNCIRTGNYIAYTARVIFSSEYVGDNVLPIEVHITVPFSFYADMFPKPAFVSETPYIAGHDVNTDRINGVIVDTRNFRAVAWKTFWFTEANIKNVSSDRAWNSIVKAIRDNIDFCISNRCFRFTFEDYELIGDWKLLDCLRCRRLRDEEANWRKFTFRSSVIEKYVKELYLRGLPLPILVDPSGTTKIAEEIHDHFGWDVHTTAAYLIACFAAINQHI